MRTDIERLDLENVVVDSCWQRIGVDGDKSCPKLAEAVHCRNCSLFAAAGQLLFRRELPADYLEQCTRQLAESKEAAAGETLAALVFRVGPEWLALDSKLIVEVVGQRPIHRIPHRSNQLLLGLANIRGELDLCVSLAALLGLDASDGREPPARPGSDKSNSRLLVTEYNSCRWVFPVDQVEGVRRVPSNALEGLPQTVQKSPRYFSEAVFRDAGRNIGLLSAERLFRALESVGR